MVVMKPLTHPNVSTTGFTAVAKQFVVHEALEMTSCLAGS